ncbi:polyphosphate--glucose phosphotransferase [Corynebacterium hindlerae]|uniref:polyphosphate--glucose phosphotransferase n=1 Tax=Corynebacterium hindlerae TaxID=699041 RepID=UPI0031B6C135
MTQQGLGIDVGGSGIKGGLVNLATGELIGDRIKIATPQPATPDAVGETVAEIVRQAEWDGPVGIALPSVIKKQHALTAANIDPTWVNTDVQELFGKHLAAREVYVLNDADAAGIAEATFGTPEASTGSAILLTLGTGIGSAFLLNGELFPNTELGHLIIEGKEAEKRASSAVKERKDLSWAQWAKRLDKVLREYERLFQPDAFIVGGGVSRKHEKWVQLLSVDTPVIPAQLRNQAGIVGAAMAVEKRLAP